MWTAFFSGIYPIILNNHIRNELKNYFGKVEIKNIIKKTNNGYKDMMKNHHNNEIGKNTFKNLCVNTYFINVYKNIENEISHDICKNIKENIINNCKILSINIE